MFIAIVRHTPVWVWGPLVVLVALALSQARDREMSLMRITILPLALTVGLFAITYSAGASLALHPALAHDTTCAGLTSLACGALSGLFLARGLALRHLARRPAGLLAAR